MHHTTVNRTLHQRLETLTSYIFARIHRTVRMSPAMVAGVTATLWTVRDIVTLLEEHEAHAAA